MRRIPVCLCAMFFLGVVLMIHAGCSQDAPKPVKNNLVQSDTISALLEKLSTDSLIHLSQMEKNDTLRLEILQLIMGGLWFDSNSQKLNAYSDSVISLATKLRKDKIKANAMLMRGMALLNQNKPDLTIQYLDSCISFVKISNLSISEKNLEIGKCEQGKNHAYLQMNQIAMQIDALYNAILHFEKTREPTFGWYRACYLNLGIAYSRLNNYPKAIESYQKALQISRSDTSTRNQSVFFILELMARVHSDQKNFMKARAILDSMKIHRNSAGTDSVFHFMAWGNYYLNLNQYDSSIINYKAAREIMNKGYDFYQFEILSKLSKAYLKNGKEYDAGEILSEMNSAKGQDYNLYQKLELSKLHLLSAIHRADGVSAIRFYDSLETQVNRLREIEAMSQMQSKEASMELQNFQTREKLKQQKAEIEQHEKNLQKNFLLAGAGVFLLLLGFIAVIQFRNNKMIKAERNKSDLLLLNILPEEVAKELKSRGEAEARQIDQVSVLFTDFKGFTAFSEKRTPKELVKDLHECFTQFDAIIQKYGLEKIKTIGDSYMAAGGLPLPNDTHASDTVMAALEIRDYIESEKNRKQANNEPFFEVRIGVHTGPVVAGIVGVKKFSYDIWGDTVNTASRMESSGFPGKVNISEATYLLINEKFNCSFRGKIEAKGKGQMDMYFVERPV